MGAKEVAAGAEWLDENFPGWEREIDLGTLDLKQCDVCICGQSLRKYINDQFSNGFDFALFKASGTYSAYGWAQNHGFFVKGENEDWAAEETIWRDLIKERFSTGNLSDNHVE